METISKASEVNIAALKSLLNLEGFTFNIPDYQRGYRWTDEQVDNLLNDLEAFFSNKKDKEIFFLQPLVVRKLQEGYWELIDGQQRLTTLFLLGHVLDAIFSEFNAKSINFKLEYSESKGKGFIERVAADPLADDWEGSNSSPDFYFIANACKKIREWVKNNKEKIITSNILYGLKKDVQFLWHDTSHEPGSAAKDFERLNTGKIPLTDGELCRALTLVRQNVNDELPVLTGISENFRDAIRSELTDSIIARRQIIQAGGWDEGEKLLWNDEFWQFLGNPSGFQTRMDFLLQLHYGLAPDYPEQYVVFDSLYNTLGKDSTQKPHDGYAAWAELKQSLLRLQSWFNDPDYYHWIGYLSRLHPRHVRDLLKKSRELSASEFKEEVFKRIRDSIGRTTPDLDQIQYDSGYDTRPWRLLFLFNVEYARTHPLGFARFPFAQFTKRQSIEHIFPRNPHDISTVEEMKDWLESKKIFLEALEKREIEEIFPLKTIDEEANENRDPESEKTIADKLWKQKEKLLEDFQKLQGDFNKLKPKESANELRSSFDELSKNFYDFMNKLDKDEDENSLWNLCLIDKNINSSLGNAQFSGKQIKLREILDNGGEYVPPATQALFMRHFMKKAFNRSWWSKDDRDALRRVMHETLSVFWPDLSQKLNTKGYSNAQD